MMRTLHLVKLFKPDCIHGKFPANQLDSVSRSMKPVPEYITDENIHQFLHGKTFILKDKHGRLGRYGDHPNWRFGFTTNANGERPGEIYCSDLNTSTRLDQVVFAKRDNIRIIT